MTCRIVVLISGSGSNLQSLLDASQGGELGDADVVAVLSNKPGAYGLETAFASDFGPDGAPCVAILAEYDALPHIGHACGHNLIAVSGVGAGLALAALGPRVPGRVRVLGTPAEEQQGGKIELLNRHAFEDIDVALMVHPSPGMSL